MKVNFDCLNTKILYKKIFKVVACINGTGFAAACLLTLACDYRILVDNPKKGSK